MNRWFIKGDIYLKNLNIKITDRLTKYISNSLDELMNFDSKAIYISGDFDCELE